MPILRATASAAGTRRRISRSASSFGKIYDSIRDYGKLLLVLSQKSVRRSWVQDEVEACCEREQRQQRQMLFPIRLDGGVMDTEQAWAATIRRRWHIGDLTRWHEPTSYHKAVERFLRDLKAPKRNS